MELNIVKHKGNDIVVLLDDNLKIVKPVYDYLKYLRLKDRALNTLKANGRDLKLYWNFLNEKGYEYNEVTPNMIGEFKEYLRKPNVDDNLVIVYGESIRTARTINRILSTIYNFYKYCGEIREIDNPIIMEEVNRPFNMFKSLLYHTKGNNNTEQSMFKVKESKRTIKLVSGEDAQSFFDNLPTWRDKLIFKIMYLTGARVGEVLDLQIEDIPVPNSLKKVGTLESIKSKGKRRDLYLPMPLLEEIDNFIMERRNNIDTEHSYIFVSQQKQNLGKPLTYRGIYEVFDIVKKKTGISFNFHDLRHTYITHLVENGMDISVVRIIAGHEFVTTTQQYTHISNKYLEDSLSRYWSKSILIGDDLNGN